MVSKIPLVFFLLSEVSSEFILCYIYIMGIQNLLIIFICLIVVIYYIIHSYFCNLKHGFNKFQQIIIKNQKLIDKIKIDKFKYNENNNKTLLFIDSRKLDHMSSLFRLFLYSVDSSWNFTIICTKECVDFYRDICIKLGVQPKIIVLKFPLKNRSDYNKMLFTKDFWDLIREENILLFQSDSIVFGKFKNDFLKYDYIGSLIPGFELIMNGGTSFRKKSMMLKCIKKYPVSKLTSSFDNIYGNMLIDGIIGEDIYFSRCVSKLNENITDKNIAHKFSSEAFHCQSSYGHQIWMNPFLNFELIDLEDYIENKIKKIVNEQR
jgi:hypothetical protein